MEKELCTNDLVFYNDKGKIKAGGFMIKNTLLEQRLPAMGINNKKNITGGSVSSLFNDLAIPAGLLYLQQNMTTNHYHEKHPEMMDNSIYDKLLGLAEDKQERKLTKKSKKSKPRKTRKKNNKK